MTVNYSLNYISYYQRKIKQEPLQLGGENEGGIEGRESENSKINISLLNSP